MQNILKRKRAIPIIVSVLLTAAVLAACSGKENKQQNAQLQAAKEKQSQEKESEKLKKTESLIEKLFEALGGPGMKTGESADEETSDKQQSPQDGGKQKETKQDDAQKDDQQKNSSESGQESSHKSGQRQNADEAAGREDGSKAREPGQEGKQDEQQVPDKWSQVSSIITDLHYQWNDLMPEIAQKGADMKLVDNFDNALNGLTTTVQTKDREKVLSSANKLYSYIPDLYSLYRVKMSPEVKRMIYYTRNIILESSREAWDQVVKDNEALGRSWSLLRNTLDKEQKKIEDKLDFSIYELKKVVEGKNRQLSSIKGRIVLNNIAELQKSFEEQK